MPGGEDVADLLFPGLGVAGRLRNSLSCRKGEVDRVEGLFLLLLSTSLSGSVGFLRGRSRAQSTFLYEDWAVRQAANPSWLC